VLYFRSTEGQLYVQMNDPACERMVVLWAAAREKRGASETTDKIRMMFSFD